MPNYQICTVPSTFVAKHIDQFKPLTHASHVIRTDSEYGMAVEFILPSNQRFLVSIDPDYKREPEIRIQLLHVAEEEEE